MKHMKKIISLILAMLMIVSLAVSVSAESIEIKDDEGLRTGHTYKVYQIFTAELDGGVLTEVKYGENYYPDGKSEGDPVPTAELKDLEGTEEALAKEFAKKLIDNNLLVGEAIATLNEESDWKATGLDYGYYLIVDVTEELPDFHSYSAYMVKVVGTVEMAPKADITDDDKTIKKDDYEDNLNGDDSVTTDGKASNGAVGSVVWFELTVDVPANADEYTYYYCILSDNLSEGLTFNPESVTVTVNGEENEEYKLYTEVEDFYIPANSKNEDHYANADFQVAMTNAKDLAGKQIVLSYSATINKDAIIGVEGNPNDFNTIYSNDPNYEYDENKEPDGPDGKPDEDDNDPIGETPVKRTITYLTGLKLKKVDENGNTLKGATFKLEGESVKHVLIEEEVFNVDPDGTYYKLKDGKYTEEAPRLNDKYVVKTAEEGRDGGYVLSVDGTYKEATEDELADDTITLYKLLAANSDSYEDTLTKYVKSIVFKEEIDSETEDVEVEVGADGIIYFSGLGEGEYTITETVTPAGYNTIEPITVTIDWELPTGWESIDPNNDNCEWTVNASNGTGALTMNNDGVFELEVVNVKGVELPETGGIGTTIFYIVGGLLAAAAIVLLVAKKRMSSAE